MPAASILLVGSALAQDPAAQAQKLADAFEKAQREAVRPGDDRLDCAAVAQQLVAAVQAPAVQDHVATSGAQAQKDLERSKPDAKPMTAQAALAVFSSLAPGGAWAGAMADAGQIPAQQLQTAQNLQLRMQQADEMTGDVAREYRMYMSFDSMTAQGAKGTATVTNERAKWFAVRKSETPCRTAQG